MMAVDISAGLIVYPPFQFYNDTTGFTSLSCLNDSDSYMYADDTEWLNPNFTIMTSSPDYRVIGTYIAT